MKAASEGLRALVPFPWGLKRGFCQQGEGDRPPSIFKKTPIIHVFHIFLACNYC